MSMRLLRTARRLLGFWRRGGQDLRLLWFALRHPHRPAWLILAVALLAFSAFEPLNFTLPLFGVIDDLLVLPLVLHWLVKCLPREIRGDFNARGYRPQVT